MTTIGDAGAALRARGDCQLDVRYGPGPRCLLDIFPADERRRSCSSFTAATGARSTSPIVSFIAEPFAKLG